MKILISGNPNFGLAKEMNESLAENELTFCSRSSGYDLTQYTTKERFANLALDHDVIIINSSLYGFHQSLLTGVVYNKLLENKKTSKIICIGSTISRYNKPYERNYDHEKKALKDMVNSMFVKTVWEGGPKITLLSFGGLTIKRNVKEGEKFIQLSEASSYIKWVIDQPYHININELCLSPLQYPDY